VGEAYGHGGVEVLDSGDQVGVGVGVAGGDAARAQGDEGREEEEEFEEVEVGVHCCGWGESGGTRDWFGWFRRVGGIEGVGEVVVEDDR
jgi:hypothetical protein